MRRLTVVAAFVLMFVARDVAAQGFISPFVGTTLSTPSTHGSRSKPGFGLALGGIGKIIGVESEFAYYPEVFDNDANGLGKSKVFTISGNTLIGPMIGPVKVYGAFGFGGLHLDVTSIASAFIPNPTDVSSNYFTYNVGGGLMVLFAPHLGVRGDLRYYKAFGFNQSDLQDAGLTIDKFDFWRAGGGLVVEF